MKIILYTKKGCPWSPGIIDLLTEKGVYFVEKDVSENQANLDEMVAKSGQGKAPTIEIDGEITADTDREAVEKLLLAKNYGNS